MKEPFDENFSIINLKPFKDSRGSLIAIENLSFQIKRIYYIYGNNKNAIRGKHAHKKLKQLLISVSGSCHPGSLGLGHNSASRGMHRDR